MGADAVFTPMRTSGAGGVITPTVRAMSTSAISLDRWYALAVANGQERKIREAILKVVADNKLGREVRDVVLPEQEEVVDAGTPQARKVMRNKLPGYLLIRARRLSPTTVFKITAVKNVMEFMGGDDHPTEMPAAEVRRITGKGAAATPSRARFAVDDVVKVVRGPMAQFTGKVESVNAGKQKLRALVEIFGRETPVELGFDDVVRA